MRKTKKVKGKQQKASETAIVPKHQQAICLTEVEQTTLKINEILDTNPIFKGLPRPTVEYIEYFMKQQPELKMMPHIEMRERYLNVLILAYIRDTTFKDIAFAQEEHGSKWREHIEAKEIRVLTKVMEIQDRLTPKIFSETKGGFNEILTGKKIKATLIEKTIIIEPEETLDGPEGDNK